MSIGNVLGRNVPMSGDCWVVLAACTIGRPGNKVSSDSSAPCYMAVQMTHRSNKAADNGDLANVRPKSTPKAVIGTWFVNSAGMDLDPKPRMSKPSPLCHGHQERCHLFSQSRSATRTFSLNMA